MTYWHIAESNFNIVHCFFILADISYGQLPLSAISLLENLLWVFCSHVRRHLLFVHIFSLHFPGRVFPRVRANESPVRAVHLAGGFISNSRGRFSAASGDPTTVHRPADWPDIFLTSLLFLSLFFFLRSISLFFLPFFILLSFPFSFLCLFPFIFFYILWDELLNAVNMSILVFWFVTSLSGLKIQYVFRNVGIYVQGHTA